MHFPSMTFWPVFYLVMACSAAVAATLNAVALLRRDRIAPSSVAAVFWVGFVAWYGLVGGVNTQSESLGLSFCLVFSVYFALKSTAVFSAKDTGAFNMSVYRGIFGDRFADRMADGVRRTREREDERLRAMRELEAVTRQQREKD